MCALSTILDRLPQLAIAGLQRGAALMPQSTRPRGGYYAALDLGTACTKAVVFETHAGEARVTGVGRHQQGLANLRSATVTNIRAVAAICDEALEQAERMAGVSPEQIVVGIAGEFVRGGTTTIAVERARPEQRLTRRELENLIAHAQREALRRMRGQLVWECGVKQPDVGLVDAAIIEVALDGHRIEDPLGLRGRQIDVTLFNAFAPLGYLGALRSVAHELGLDVRAIVAESCAVACCLRPAHGAELGGIFLDIGSGTTDMTLVRHGGIESTRAFPLGGRAFTKRLALTLALEFDQAERLKLRYATGVLERATAAQVREILDSDAAVWLSGVELLLEELAGPGMLPPRFFLCGGGSQLPEIGRAMQAYPWPERLPFARHPLVHLIEPHDVWGIWDETGQLRGQQDITLLALAAQALGRERELEQSTLDDVLQTVNRVVRR
jgi:cell division protein FtsA